MACVTETFSVLEVFLIDFFSMWQLAEITLKIEKLPPPVLEF